MTRELCKSLEHDGKNEIHDGKSEWQYDRKLIACWRKVDRLLAQLGDAVRQARNLPAGGVLMNDAFLGRSHDDGLCVCEGRLGLAAVTGGDGFLDLYHGSAQTRAPGLIDEGAPSDLAGCLTG
jgi:hypothetical protein